LLVQKIKWKTWKIMSLSENQSFFKSPRPYQIIWTCLNCTSSSIWACLMTMSCCCLLIACYRSCCKTRMIGHYLQMSKDHVSVLFVSRSFLRSTSLPFAQTLSLELYCLLTTFSVVKFRQCSSWWQSSPVWALFLSIRPFSWLKLLYHLWGACIFFCEVLTSLFWANVACFPHQKSYFSNRPVIDFGFTVFPWVP